MARASDELLDVAVAAAEAGGAVIVSAEGSGRTETKGTGDYVTHVDRASEAAITRVLREARPDIPVVGEEEGGTAGDTHWVVDPLDGTANYLHGFPVVAVSVALIHDGVPSVGAVLAPRLGDLFVGVRGEGAERRREGTSAPMRVARRDVEASIVATGFPFRDKSLVPRYLPVFERCFARFEDLRRAGAAALDLAWTAAGVFDGFFELDLSPWDVAAGALLVREAGGVVTDWDGDDRRWLETGNILAGSPAVHAELLEIARG